MQTKTIVILVIVMVLVVSIVVGLLAFGGIAFLKSKTDSKQEQVGYINFLVKARNIEEQNQSLSVNADYIMHVNNQVAQQGKLIEGNWLHTLVQNNTLPTVSCWSDNFYLVRASKLITSSDIEQNQSVLTCDMVKIGQPTITYSGDLNSRFNKIIINISEKDWFYKTAMCFSWSAGIIDVSIPEQIANCPSQWKNYSAYDTKTKTYTWLKTNQWTCDNQRYELCGVVKNNQTECQLSIESVPARLKGKVDNCVNIGKTLHNENFIIELTVRTLDVKNILDYVKIYTYDKDRRWDGTDFNWVSEEAGKDIGAKDIETTIYYSSNGRSE